MLKDFQYIGNREYLIIDTKFQEKIYCSSYDLISLFEKVASVYQKHHLPVAVNIAALYYTQGYRGIYFNLERSTVLASYRSCITNILATKYNYNLKNLCHL